MSKWICIDDLEYDTDWDSYADGFTAYSQLAIDTAPSIDLVRCGECKYHNGEYCFRLVSKDAWDLIGSQCVITMQPDDYCSYGEREDE